MNLIYLLQRASWFVESREIWYHLDDEVSLALAQSVLKLISIDEFELSDQPVRSGRAELIASSEDCVTVILRDKNNVVVEELELLVDASLLSVVDWREPPFPDGWVSSSVQLEVEHTSQLTLEIFLPESGSDHSKTLTVCRDDGHTTQHELKRGLQTDCIIQNSQSPCDGKFHLSCEPEVSSDPNDVRSLGFVLANTVITV